MESSIINGTMLIWIPIFAVMFLGERITGKEIIGLLAAGAGTLIVQLRRLPAFKKLPGQLRRAHSAIWNTVKSNWSYLRTKQIWLHQEKPPISFYKEER
jgi:hypothetical protein